MRWFVPNRSVTREPAPNGCGSHSWAIKLFNLRQPQRPERFSISRLSNYPVKEIPGMTKTRARFTARIAHTLPPSCVASINLPVKQGAETQGNCVIVFAGVLGGVVRKKHTDEVVATLPQQTWIYIPERVAIRAGPPRTSGRTSWRWHIAGVTTRRRLQEGHRKGTHGSDCEEAGPGTARKRGGRLAARCGAARKVAEEGGGFSTEAQADLEPDIPHKAGRRMPEHDMSSAT